MLLQDEFCRPLPDGTFAERRARGAVYTPPVLAAWVAQMLLSKIAGRPRVLDLGCGDGALLEPIRVLLPQAQAVGIELNPEAVRRAEEALTKRVKILRANVLCPSNQSDRLLKTHWIRVLGFRPDAVIMNPPWGADDCIERSAARATGLTLAAGQFDTYDLFCELALQLLPEGGRYAFILPDSLFLPEHEGLRRLLTETTSIELIARLGEGVFSGVYRGCVVVVGTVGRASEAHKVECIRFTKEDRRELSSAAAFDLARGRLRHFVAQSRFQGDRRAHFDIDVRDADRWVNKIRACGGDWTSLLNSRRGVELSKSGKVLTCQACGTSRPAPKTASSKCPSCGASAALQKHSTIVTKLNQPSSLWKEFIVGEDVCRYVVRPQRWIKLGVSGIKYKNAPKVGEARILIRKTGIGINASLDHSGAYTNQVVFEYTAKKNIEFDFCYLHFVLGVLCSRVMFAFYLRSCGEIEWRSHPYLTQKTIAMLPVPVPEKVWEKRQAAAIASAVERHLAMGGGDLEIESLVAGMFNLDECEVAGIVEAINTAEGLQHMRLLRISDATTVKPERVI